MESDVPKYMIATVSQMFNIHPQTLRMYERVGLIEPTRSKGNTRLYSDCDLERIKKILTLTRDMGVNLAGVEVIMRLQDQLSVMQIEFNTFIDCLRSELEKVDKARSREFEKVLIKVNQLIVSVVNPEENRENS